MKWLLFIVALAIARPASACSVPAAIQDWRIVPADGATGVPTNVRVAVRYFGTSMEPALGDIQIQPVGGQPLNAAVETGVTSHPLRQIFFLRPAGALAPNTMYQILTRVSTVPCLQLPCTTSTYSVSATFTTGSGADTTAPTYGGLSNPRGFVQSCANEACCGPYRVVLYGFDPGTPTDDIGLAGWNLYRVGTGKISDLTGFAGFALCSGIPNGGGPPGEFMAPVGMFYAHAVDLAGNEDSNMQLVTIPASCADTGDGGTPDAATVDALVRDAAAPDAANPAAPSSDAGCSCAVTHSQNPPFALVLLLLLRRRR